MAFLRHIALRTKDMETSRRFYETIGFAFVGYRGRSGLDLSDGTLNMTILQYNGTERPPFEEGTEFIHFGIIVEDLAKIYNTLRDGGFELIMDNVKKGDDIDDNKPPERSFKVADPDGNVVDITGAKDEWRGVTV
ncbi:VOC family protein [Candidatus Poribacteria bacterium]|nr:VOC family protein [Candidatus Poribacteria bacterium]